MIAAAHEEEAGTGAAIDFIRLEMRPQPGKDDCDDEPGAVGGTLRAGPHSVRKSLAAKDLFAR